jgi:hypothetical protein
LTTSHRLTDAVVLPGSPNGLSAILPLRPEPSAYGLGWIPTDAPLMLRNVSTTDVYSLTLEQK